MREIKFRAWDEQRKVMHQEFNFIQSFGEGNNWIIPIKPIFNPEWIKDLQENITLAPHFRQQFKLMQYTGQKDKNGKEIYEGDILIDDEYPEEGICYGIVEWYESGWTVEPWFNVSEFKEMENYEVIGNIYENPELLDERNLP